jgi:PAS domain S-box-containing protein
LHPAAVESSVVHRQHKGGAMNPLLLSKLVEIRNVSLERATSLRKRANAKEQPEQHWMSEALEELDVTHEELRVVEEELHAQSEELSAVYGALEQDRSRYRDLFEGAPEPYLVTDTAGVVLEANQLACRLLNIESVFVIGKPMGLYVSGADRALMREVLSLLNSTSERSSFEIQLRPRGASEPVDVSAMVHRARENNGRSSTLRWILHEQRAARDHGVFGARSSAVPKSEAPHAEQVTAPENDLKQLEVDLAREQVRRIEAERELKRRNDQLAFIAHELRNPLSTTAGWLEILNQDGTGVASRRHVLGVLSRNVKTLARMVGELVDRTRVVQGLVLDCEDADFPALLARVSDDARGMAQLKRLQFTCEIDPSVGIVRCDAYRIQQALSNVLGNAMKFTSSDGGMVQLFAAVRGDMVECMVHDTGPGIAAEYLKTIFEPFIRVNARGGSAGLGLGLNIALTLIELHGGSIAAESDGAGHGATFRIRLPLAGPPQVAVG